MDKRIEILKQIDNRLAEIIPYIFFSSQIMEEFFTGTKYQTPEYVFDKFGQEESIITYWWEDPVMVKELDQAMETDQALAKKPFKVVYQNEVYLIRQLLLIPTLLGITAICFTLIQFVPGDPS